MSEIEQAIEHYSYGISHDIFSEPVTTYSRLSITALREQAEREKGCAFCNDPKIRKLYGFKFCGECGRRLEVKQDG